MSIFWKYNGTEVYVNGIYAGYIEPIGEIGGWYGNLIIDGHPTEHFGVEYGKEIIQRDIERFINTHHEYFKENKW